MRHQLTGFFPKSGRNRFTHHPGKPPSGLRTTLYYTPNPPQAHFKTWLPKFALLTTSSIPRTRVWVYTIAISAPMASFRGSEARLWMWGAQWNSIGSILYHTLTCNVRFRKIRSRECQPRKTTLLVPGTCESATCTYMTYPSTYGCDHIK